MKKNTTVCLCLLFFCCASLYAQVTQRNLLSRFSLNDIQQNLLTKDKWKPYPQTAAGWRSNMPDSLVQLVIKDGERVNGKPFIDVTAGISLDFVRTGNRSVYETTSFNKRNQLFALVLAESVERKGRFTESIMNGVWSICEETYWGAAAHLGVQKARAGLADVEDPIVDLFGAETAALLALTDYLVGDELDTLSPLLRKRIYYEVNRKILTPLEKESNRYVYMGFGKRDIKVNNWNPWVISNWMTALLLLEKDNTRRVNEMHHAMNLLDLYINGLGDDGATDEGPSYFFAAGVALFDGLTMIESATGGKVIIWNDPVIKQMGSYIYKTHIGGDYFMNVADANPKNNVNGITLYRFGRAVKDTVMMRFGAWAYHTIDDHVFSSQGFFKPRHIMDLLGAKECAVAQGQPPMLQDVWLQSVQVMSTRTNDNLFVASHGGHNAESHNHNDVGDFIVYANNKPVIIDVGRGTYMAITFSKDRYKLWYNTSPYHNLPTINGKEQLAGRNYEATNVSYSTNAKQTKFQCDIAKSYDSTAGVQQWIRTLTIDKTKNSVTINDNYQMKAPLTSLTQTFMTVAQVNTATPGKIVFSIPGEKDVTLSYDAKSWNVSTEKMTFNKPDEKAIPSNWGTPDMYRILLTAKQNGMKGSFQYVITQ